VPVIATAFVIVTLSSIGLPGTNGFVGEFLILSGTWLSRLRSSAVFATLAAIGVILGAVYMLLLVEKVFFGPIRKPENRHLPDLSVREGFVLAPMIALIVVMGILPGPFLAPAKPSVDRLVQRFQVAEARLGRGPQVGTALPAVAVRAPAARAPEAPAAPAAPELAPPAPVPSGGTF
jgi:NADH-quinone oxidoreductase subunit M